MAPKASSLTGDENDAETGREIEKGPSGTGAIETVADPRVVKKMKLKADLILLPTFTVAYLFKYACALTDWAVL